MQWLAERLTDLFRPWHEDGLPEHLAFGEMAVPFFIRGSMNRAAGMAVSLNVSFGVFGIIGIEHARRAACAWRPGERLLMEDVSFAFQPVTTRATAGSPVPQIHIDRLVFVLGRYLAYVGSPSSNERLRVAIETYIRDVPRMDPIDEDGNTKRDA